MKIEGNDEKRPNTLTTTRFLLSNECTNCSLRYKIVFPFSIRLLYFYKRGIKRKTLPDFNNISARLNRSSFQIN